MRFYLSLGGEQILGFIFLFLSIFPLLQQGHFSISIPVIFRNSSTTDKLDMFFRLSEDFLTPNIDLHLLSFVTLLRLLKIP